MKNSWLFLLCRYGNEIKAPTSDQIDVAANELFHENISGMSEGDYSEHGSLSLRYGFDDGPMYVLEITRGGLARWEEWADQDYNDELAPMREISRVTEVRAIELLNALANGNFEFVRTEFSKTA